MPVARHPDDLGQTAQHGDPRASVRAQAHFVEARLLQVGRERLREQLVQRLFKRVYRDEKNEDGRVEHWGGAGEKGADLILGRKP